jgi:protein-tyrosine phosphatase
MIKVLFICHGNICRSPMAEFIFKDMVEKAGCADRFYIESAATSTEEIGNPVYPPARKRLAKAGISCAGKTARQITVADYEEFDYLIGMDDWNIRNMNRFWHGDKDGKIIKLLDLTELKRDVADPWYTGDFEQTYQDIVVGCKAILKQLGESNQPLAK